MSRLPFPAELHPVHNLFERAYKEEVKSDCFLKATVAVFKFMKVHPESEHATLISNWLRCYTRNMLTQQLELGPPRIHEDEIETYQSFCAVFVILHEVVEEVIKLDPHLQTAFEYWRPFIEAWVEGDDDVFDRIGILRRFPILRAA